MGICNIKMLLDVMVMTIEKFNGHFQKSNGERRQRKKRKLMFGKFNFYNDSFKKCSSINYNTACYFIHFFILHRVV